MKDSEEIKRDIEQYPVIVDKEDDFGGTAKLMRLKDRLHEFNLSVETKNDNFYIAGDSLKNPINLGGSLLAAKNTLDVDIEANKFLKDMNGRTILVHAHEKDNEVPDPKDALDSFKNYCEIFSKTPDTSKFKQEAENSSANKAKGHYYSKEAIEKADKTSVVALAEKVGVGLKQSGHDEFRGIDHDSLVITPSKNSWFWNSRSIGGKGGLSFAEDYILRDEPDKKGQFLKAMKLVTDAKVGEAEVKEIKKEPFKLNTSQFSNRFDKAENYLTSKRGLSPFLIDKLHKQGIIKQDKFGNALFLWKDPINKNIKGVTKQGTTINHEKYGKRGTIKQIERNSESGYGFSFDSLDSKGKTPENIRFFESSIDALSYYNLNPKKLSDTRFVSMDGLKKEVVANYLNLTAKQLAKEGKSIKSIAFGVDNDEAGNKFMKEMSKLQAKNRDGQVIELKSAQPSTKYGKDWNDVLKSVRKMVKEKEIKHEKAKENYFAQRQNMQTTV